MTSKRLYMDVSGCTGVMSIQTEASHSAISANASVECTGTTLDLSDSVTIDAGYSTSHGVLFKGYVKRIERMTPDKTYRVTLQDPLIRAVDNFLASDDPESPLTYHSITDYDLVNAMLSESSLPSLSSAQPFPSFTLGTNADGAKFNLQSASDVLQFMCSITGRLIYADNDGDIYYVDRKPYVDGDTPTLTFVGGNSGNIFDASYEKSSDKTRNVIKVYGLSPLTARASVSLSFLVVDQTAVIAHELLDEAGLCQRVADINLALLSKLQETYSLTVEGDHNIQARKVASLTEPFLGVSNRSVYLYRVAHSLSQEGGYICNITAIP
jgi:hypothetical protein